MTVDYVSESCLGGQAEPGIHVDEIDQMNTARRLANSNPNVLGFENLSRIGQAYQASPFGAI